MEALLSKKPYQEQYEIILEFALAEEDEQLATALSLYQCPRINPFFIAVRKKINLAAMSTRLEKREDLNKLEELFRTRSFKETCLSLDTIELFRNFVPEPWKETVEYKRMIEKLTEQVLFSPLYLKNKNTRLSKFELYMAEIIEGAVYDEDGNKLPDKRNNRYPEVRPIVRQKNREWSQELLNALNGTDNEFKTNRIDETLRKFSYDKWLKHYETYLEPIKEYLKVPRLTQILEEKEWFYDDPEAFDKIPPPKIEFPKKKKRKEETGLMLPPAKKAKKAEPSTNSEPKVKKEVIDVSEESESTLKGGPESDSYSVSRGR